MLITQGSRGYSCKLIIIIIIIVIFNEDANVTKWFTEGSSEEY